MKWNPTTAEPLSVFPMPNRDHIQGPVDAPMMLLEYGDYECPYCGAAHPVIKEIQKRLGDRVDTDLFCRVQSSRSHASQLP